MEQINNNPILKKSLEGVALLIALVGAFYLGQNVTEIAYVDTENQTASVISAVSADPFAGYEYVLIDNSQGIRDIKTK